MSYQTLAFTRAAGIATITLRRPASFNALDLQMSRDLLDVANICSTDRDVRCVILTGDGDKAFCAGGDIAGFVAAGDDVQRLIQDMTTNLHMAISRFTWMRAPVIAAVNGVAAGAGLSIMAFCDLAIAADTARFTSAYTRIGLTPDGSSSFFLSHLIGRRRAMELYFTNRTLSATEALDWGLVNRVVPHAELEATVRAMAGMIAENAPLTVKAVKICVGEIVKGPAAMDRALCDQVVETCFASADYVEGRRAFMEKRKPAFQGR